ncbi:MAG: metal ABC transporter permease [Patescibacteria group bacterium]
MTLEALIVGCAVGVAASLLGVFVILRRLALISDVLSHVALPGMGVALMVGASPFAGALAALLLAVAGISFVERRFSVAIETVVGIIFTVSLALGTLLVPSEELLEALFGDIESVTRGDAVLAVAASVVLVGMVLFFFKQFARVTFSRELAKESTMTSIHQTEFAFLAAIAFAIAIGIQVVGMLLMGALVVLPAAAAKNITRSLKGMAVWAVLFGVAMFAAGIAFAAVFAAPPGAAIVLCGGVLFLVSLVVRAARGR